MQSFTISMLTLFAGGLLSLMVYFNGLLAKYISPFEASLVVHLVGLVTALIIWIFFRPKNKEPHKKIPFWPFLAGIFGGIAVAINGMTVNSPVGVAGTIGLFVLGQVIYSWFNDSWGWFGTPRRKLTLLDFLQAFFILAGVGVLIYG